MCLISKLRRLLFQTPPAPVRVVLRPKCRWRSGVGRETSRAVAGGGRRCGVWELLSDAGSGCVVRPQVSHAPPQGCWSTAASGRSSLPLAKAFANARNEISVLSLKAWSVRRCDGKCLEFSSRAMAFW